MNHIEFIKTVAVAMCVAALSFAYADDAGEVVKVKGTGTGATEEAALKDAYRDAVESAVGMFVDAEQLMKNDELIKDQILTHSNAYVEKRTVLSKEEKDGVVKVKILAEVRKRELTTRIKEVMPSQTVKVGNTLGNIHAVNESKEKRSADGASLLQNALSDFHPTTTLVDFTLMSSEPAVFQSKRNRKKGGGDGIFYPFMTQINPERYQQLVVARLQPVLAQISLTQPRKVGLPVSIRGGIEVGTMRQSFQGPNRKGSVFERAITAPKVGKKIAGDPLRIDEPYNSLLVTGINPSGTIAEVEMYQLDDAARAAFVAWAKNEKCPEYRVVFKDGNGASLYQAGMRPAFCDCYDLRYKKVIFAPWAIKGRNSTIGVAEWRSVEVPREVQPSVQSITVEQIK